MKKVIYSAIFGEPAYPFHNLALKTVVVRKAAEMTEPNSVLVVWGGSDINPALYKHPKSRTTHCYEGRDVAEWELMNKAVEMGIPIIGVCRGAQMLCALAGGFLIQDVGGHAGGRGHSITTHTGDVLSVNSIHHQMMAGLEGVEHELLAWSTEHRSQHYIWKNDEIYTPPEGFVEPEFVYFPKIKGFAVQWHPEGMSENCLATTFIMEQYYARTEETVI